ncbi:MAG: DUF1844 domain-containing protein [bacterium]|nr:DUF1844 domain-containing protein [bacterium]
MSFVFGLMQSGMMQLGKLVNPVTGKIEKNLAAAQSTIDLLRMLREKTSGNLDKAENDLLNNAISTLQLNYVDEVEHTSAQGPTSDNANDSSRASEGHQSAHTQQ